MIAIASPNTSDLINAMLTMPLVALVADIATALEMSLNETLDLVADAEDEGAVQSWPDCPDGPSICLSALTVERLNLEPCPRSGRWVHRGRARPELRSSTPGARGTLATDLVDEDGRDLFDVLEDPKALTPGQLSELAEQAGAMLASLDGAKSDYITATLRHAFHPPLRYLLGTTQQWGASKPEGACPICFGVELPELTYCLACDRYSADALMGWKPPASRVTTTKARPKARPKGRKTTVGLKGGRA